MSLIWLRVHLAQFLQKITQSVDSPLLHFLYDLSFGLNLRDFEFAFEIPGWACNGIRYDSFSINIYLYIHSILHQLILFDSLDFNN